MDPKLPAFLTVRNVANQGKGIFSKKLIPKGEIVFKNEPYSFGIAGKTLDDIRGLCYHCLAYVRDKKDCVVCSSCKVVGYCSKACQESARKLHSMECKGMSELRGKAPEGNSEIDGKSYWPPVDAVIVARAINKRYLDRVCPRRDEWIKYLSRHKLPQNKKDRYLSIKMYIRSLVHGNVSDDEMYQMYCAESINSREIQGMCPSGTLACTMHFEYSLLNHLCQPNCDSEDDNTAATVYAIQDIEPDSQLGISYLNSRVGINVREVRRMELKRSFGFDCCCVVCAGEEVIGSPYWFLEQAKKSLIAPWSRKMADDIMKQGWNVVQISERTEKLSAVQMLESEIEIQKLVLDKRNVTFILTAWQLLRNYYLLQDYKKGLAHFKALGEVGINAFFEYGTATYVDAVSKLIITCCNHLGMVKECRELEELLFKFFPKVPSSDMWHVTRGIIPPSTLQRFQQEYDQMAKKVQRIPACEVASYIYRLCDQVNRVE